MDFSPPGCSVHGILQARILEWVAMPFSRGPSQPRDQTRIFCVSCIAGVSLPTESPGKPPLNEHMPINHLMPCYTHTHTHTHTHSLMLCACLRTKHRDTGVTESAWSCPCSRGTDSLAKETKVLQINVSSMECARKGPFFFF